LSRSSRAPYGARGLKLFVLLSPFPRPGSRAPYGARGLKLVTIDNTAVSAGRAPYGARGLKRLGHAGLAADQLVAPRTGRVD